MQNSDDEIKEYTTSKDWTVGKNDGTLKKKLLA
jgi:hypothetical protein